MTPPMIPRRATLDMRTALRRLVLGIGVMETIALAAFAGLMLQSSDPLGASIGRGVTMLMAAPYAVCTVPAMVLAWRNRLLPLALALVVLAIPAAIFLWQRA